MVVKTRLRCAAGSDPGRVRGNNEDACHVDSDRGIFLVVDGIGGHNAGEKAAEIAVARIKARLERQTGAAELRIREAIALANNAILEASKTNPDWEGMACVLTLVVLDNGSAVVGHVGDSRLYQIRRGEIRKITHDHSPVGEREDSGELSEGEAMRHPRRNEVFRDVGSDEHAPDDAGFIEVLRIPFEPDSALLLCSDGLSDQVPSAEIRRLVERNAARPQVAVRDLIAAANRAGGKDNVTVIVIAGEQFTAPEPPPAAPRRRRFFSGPALFLLGVLLTAAGAWFSRARWVPPPVVFTPRVLIVGAGQPYTTIESANREARPGDTVEVRAGDFREQVTLKSGVALRSRPSRVATLRAPEGAKGPAVVADGVKDARISGFQILSDSQAPLSAGVLLRNSEVELDDLDISGAAIGVEIHGGAASLIGNAIHDCASQGILVADGASAWLSHNSLRSAGLTVNAGSTPALVGNTFDKSRLDLPPATDQSRVREKNFFLENPPRGGRK